MSSNCLLMNYLSSHFSASFISKANEFEISSKWEDIPSNNLITTWQRRCCWQIFPASCLRESSVSKVDKWSLSDVNQRLISTLSPRYLISLQDVFLMIRRHKTTIFTDAKESTTVYELKRIVEGILKRPPEDQRLYKVTLCLPVEKWSLMEQYKAHDQLFINYCHTLRDY